MLPKNDILIASARRKVAVLLAPYGGRFPYQSSKLMLSEKVLRAQALKESADRLEAGYAEQYESEKRAEESFLRTLLWGDEAEGRNFDSDVEHAVDVFLADGGSAVELLGMLAEVARYAAPQQRPDDDESAETEYDRLADGLEKLAAEMSGLTGEEAR